MFDKIRDAGLAIKSLFFSKKVYFENLEVRGSSLFCQKVSLALSSIEEKDAGAYRTIISSLSDVMEVRTKTFLSVSRWGVSLTVGEDEFNNSSKTWLASLLVYEGFRAAEYLENLKKYGGSGKISKELYSGKKIWDLHYETLKKLGVEYEELKHWADFIES